MKQVIIGLSCGLDQAERHRTYKLGARSASEAEQGAKETRPAW